MRHAAGKKTSGSRVGGTNFVEVGWANGDELDCIAALHGGKRVSCINRPNKSVIALQMPWRVRNIEKKVNYSRRMETRCSGEYATLIAMTSVMGETFMATARRGMTLLMEEVVAPTT